MGHLAEATIAQALAVLRPTVHTLDVRGLVVEHEGRQVLAAGRVIARHALVAEVRAEHRDLRHRSGVDHPRCRLVFDARPMTQIDLLLAALDRERLLVGREEVELDPMPGARWTPIRQQRAVDSVGVTVPKEADRYKHYVYTITAPDQPGDVLSRARIRVQDLQVPSWDHVSYPLGMKLFYDTGKPMLNLVLALPVYASVDVVPTRDPAHCTVNVMCHRALQRRLRVLATIQGESFRGDGVRDTRVVQAPRPNGRRGFSTFAVDAAFDASLLREGDHLHVHLSHADLGDLGLEVGVGYGYLRPSQGDRLQRALLCFDAGKRMAEWQTDSSPPDRAPLSPFAGMLANLLAVVGGRCAPLCAHADGAVVRVGGEVIGGADFLLDEPEVGLVLVGIADGQPTTRDARRLRGAAAHVAATIGERVAVAVVTADAVPTLRTDPPQHGVAVIDGERVDLLRGTVEVGNVGYARDSLRAWLRSASHPGSP